jgi:hypothetical protein
MEIIKPGIYRRDFLLRSMYLLAFGGSSAFLNGCVTTSETPNLRSPDGLPKKLSGDKIQDPRYYGLDGCMTGIWIGGDDAEWVEKKYREFTDQELSFFYLPYKYQSHIPIGLSKKTIERMGGAAKLGIISFVTYDARYGNSASPSITKDIANGEYDDRVHQSAERLLKYGEQYGGFFIRMFREMNLYKNWPWAGDPAAHIDAWRHVWEIFERKGTNQYATWVWNPCTEQGKDTANGYYPGSDYVDWIGLNAYNWGGVRGKNARGFSSLFGLAYRTHVKKGLPMMICETGVNESRVKPAYINNVYSSIKNDFRELRGIAWWSEKWKTPLGFDADTRITSSMKALNALRENLKDDYFLKKIPYRNKF